MINNIDWYISYLCDKACKYCFLSDNVKNDPNLEFNRWDDMYKFLCNEKYLDEQVKVNLVTGEVTLKPHLIKKAVSVLKKVQRVRDISFYLGTYTNGSNCDIIDEYIKSGIMLPNFVHLSWDGVHNDEIRVPKHYSPNPIKRMKCKDINVRTALTYTSMRDIDKTLDMLIEYGFNYWEYYTLIDYPEYNDDKFLELFEEFLDTIYMYRDKIYIFNIEAMNNDDNWCTHKNTSIIINIEGKIARCGISAECIYGDKNTLISDISNPDIDKVNEIMDKLCRNNHKDNRKECSCLMNKGMTHIYTQKIRLREIEDKKWREYQCTTSQNV